MASIFSVTESIETAKIKAGLSSKEKRAKVDVKMINPFLKSTIETLKVQANTEIEAGKPYIKTPECKLDIGIAGILSLSLSLIHIPSPRD